MLTRGGDGFQTLTMTECARSEDILSYSDSKMPWSWRRSVQDSALTIRASAEKLVTSCDSQAISPLNTIIFSGMYLY